MNKRERFLAFAGFEDVDRVPRRADFIEELRENVARHIGKDPRQCFDMDSGCGAGLQPPPGFKFPDYSVYHPGRRHDKDGFYIDGNGCGHLNHGFHHFTEYISPLKDAQSFEEIVKYPIADNSAWKDDEMRKVCSEAHARGDYAHVFIGHMYENAWQVRGYEAFLVDLLTQREWAELLLDRFCNNNVRTAVAAAKAGYDCIGTGDDVANQNALMFSPGVWRAVMKPRWAKVVAAARAVKKDIHVWYHSDGNIMEIIGDLIEIGITILNPVQPECLDPAAVRKRFGKKLAFDGCIGTQTTFPFGSTADMRKTVLGYAEALQARHGGLMLSPTHVLEPDVPPENVVAFFKACDELTFKR